MGSPIWRMVDLMVFKGDMVVGWGHWWECASGIE